MSRTEFTYGQLDRALKSLGFSCRISSTGQHSRLYEHKASGAWAVIPPFPESDHVLDYHLIGVRKTLDEFGIAEPKIFDRELQKAA
jgi:hypothetical protein